MQFGDFFFEGDMRKVYEAPSGFSYTIDGDGYRIYTPDDEPSAQTTTKYDFKDDIWSRYVDYMDAIEWATKAILSSGGDQRADGSYATADFVMHNGWEIVPANYPHAIIINGNVSSNSGHPLLDVLDFTSIDTKVIPLLQGADALITYKETGGSSLTTEEHDQLMSRPSADEILDNDAGCP